MFIEHDSDPLETPKTGLISERETEGFFERMAQQSKMQSVGCLLLTMIAGTSGSSQVVGQDVPYQGTVTSVDQNSALSFECAGAGIAVSCEFVQTLVSQEQPSSPERIDEMTSSALVEANTSSLCTEVPKQLEVLRSGGDFGTDLSTAQRAAALAYLEVVGSFCADPSDATAHILFGFIEERKARTCKIGTQRFDLTMDWNSQSGRWESVSTPEGGCGVVTMTFLEKDAAYPTFWNYREQTVVTNKAGSDALRGDCSVWPEEVLQFNWRPDTLRRTCEFVSFGF